MMRKAREEPEDLDQELFALACGPHSKVHTFSVYALNCVWFVTADREKGKKTQNSGIMTDGDHEGGGESILWCPEGNQTADL